VYKIWTLNSRLNRELDSGLNNELIFGLGILIARGQKSCQITQQQNFDITWYYELIIYTLQR